MTWHVPPEKYTFREFKARPFSFGGRCCAALSMGATMPGEPVGTGC